MGLVEGSLINAYSQVDNAPDNAEISHELISAAAAFEASLRWEGYTEENGKPNDLEWAKEITAGFAGAAVDRFVETKGLDMINRNKAKCQAEQHLEEGLKAEYRRKLRL